MRRSRISSVKLLARERGKKERKNSSAKRALCAERIEAARPAPCHTNMKMEEAGAIPMIAIEEMGGMEAVMEGMEMVGEEDMKAQSPRLPRRRSQRRKRCQQIGCASSSWPAANTRVETVISARTRMTLPNRRQT
jgi:hypothetical protein